MLAIGISISLETITVKTSSGSAYTYLRPDGLSAYKRPDGTSIYKRP